MSSPSLADVMAAVQELRDEMRAIVTRTASRAGRQTLSVNEAAQAYGLAPRTIRALWTTGKIEGREVPAKGRYKRALRLSRASLDLALASTPFYARRRA